jgi:hypothetical protein
MDLRLGQPISVANVRACDQFQAFANGPLVQAKIRTDSGYRAEPTSLAAEFLLRLHCYCGSAGAVGTDPSGQAATHTRLPAAVGEDPARRGVGDVDDAASCGQRRRHARLDVLASDGHVDVHRVT